MTQSVVSDAGFTHPGIFASLDNLKTTKTKVAAGEAPWTTAYQSLRDSEDATRGAPDFSTFVSAAVDPSADAEVYAGAPASLSDPAGVVTYCGAYNTPDHGCSDAQSDARAVYAQALLWWYSGDDTYAHRAIAILNAYATHFKGNRGSNGPLMTAWIAEMMLRGAEIIRYTYHPGPGDTPFDADAFEQMLRDAFVPTLTSFDWHRDKLPGNWDLSGTDGLMNTAIFLDDRDLYDQALERWRDRVPAYIYLTSDGPLPRAVSGMSSDATTIGCYWLHDRVSSCRWATPADPRATFQNGQVQETCRDFGHVGLGLSAMLNAAESAWIQGDDLYGEQQERILSGLAYTIQVSLTRSAAIPTNFCSNAPGANSLGFHTYSYEVAYNAYTVRKGVTARTLPIPGLSRNYPNNDPLAYALTRTSVVTSEVMNTSAWQTLTHHLAGVRTPSGGTESPVDPDGGTEGPIDSNEVTENPIKTSPETPTIPGVPNTGVSAFVGSLPVSVLLIAAGVAVAGLSCWILVRRR